MKILQNNKAQWCIIHLMKLVNLILKISVFATWSLLFATFFVRICMYTHWSPSDILSYISIFVIYGAFYILLFATLPSVIVVGIKAISNKLKELPALDSIQYEVKKIFVICFLILVTVGVVCLFD